MNSGCRLLVWGAGGHGRVVASVARDLGAIIAGLVDRDPRRTGPTAGEPPIACFESELVSALANGDNLPYDAEFVALGIGDNHARLACAESLGARCAPPLVHPRASVDTATELARGVVVMAGAIVGRDVRIEEAAIVNTGAIIDHDCHIGRGAHISPGAVLTGSVIVRERAWIGAGATIIPGVCIGAGSIVGAGAVVLADVASSTTVVGNPARLIHR